LLPLPLQLLRSYQIALVGVHAGGLSSFEVGLSWICRLEVSIVVVLEGGGVTTVDTHFAASARSMQAVQRIGSFDVVDADVEFRDRF